MGGVRKIRAAAETFQGKPDPNNFQRSRKETQRNNTNTHLNVGPAGVDCIDPADEGGAENAEKDDKGCGSRESW
ncbi:hypothetical protein TMatcc_005647 [Talaromyces marneffei ATCC 18224]